MINPLTTNNSQASNYNEVNKLARDVRNDQKIRIIKDEQGTPVAVLDKNGLRTTTPGKGVNVLTADEDDITFNSAFATLKIVKVMDISITAAANSVAFNGVNHGLTYAPKLLAYLIYTGTGSVPTTLIPLPYFGSQSIVSGNVETRETIKAQVNKTTVTVSYANGYSNAYTEKVRCYLMKETSTTL